MSSKEYYSSEYHSEYYYSDSDSTSAPESEYEYDYDYLEPSTTAPAPRAATDYQKRKQVHQISPSIKGTVDLWENRIAREGPNAIIAPLKVTSSFILLLTCILKGPKIIRQIQNDQKISY